MVLASALVIGLPGTDAVGQSDGEIATYIRGQVQALRAEAPSAAALGVFYEVRGYQPAWRDADRLGELVGALDGLAGDGLDPADYNVARLRMALADDALDPPGIAALDVLATKSFLLALLHVHGGKVDPARLDAHWNFEPQVFDRDVGILHELAAAVNKGEVAETIARMRPQHPVYARLRTALERLRAIEAQGGWPTLAAASLKPGTNDPAVATLRRRLVLAGHLPPEAITGNTFDADVEVAVRRFQEEQYLEVDGAVGQATRAAFNVPLQSRIAQLRVNLERARWLLPRIDGEFVMVDVAGYKVRFFRDGKAVWTSRVQVGREMRRTPIFKAEITHVTLNPTWTVPPTILREDILPKVRKDRAFLARNRIRAFTASGAELDPRQVDWSRAQGVVLRQEPGPTNSVGRIRINFPNPYSVYLHETPHTELFTRGQRSFSSGCIRVEQPFELAAILLSDSAEWSLAAIEQAVGEGKTRDVKLREAIPILVLYWTVDLHEAERIAFKPDVYDLDHKTLLALNRRSGEH